MAGMGSGISAGAAFRRRLVGIAVSAGLVLGGVFVQAGFGGSDAGRSWVKVVEFEARMVKAVKFQVLSNESWPIPEIPWPSIEEMEIYGPDSDDNLARGENVLVRAYSSRNGHPAANVNDGRYGFAHSWVPATSKGAEVVQIDLPQPVEVSRVVLSSPHGLEPMNWRLRVAADGYDWDEVYRIRQGDIPAGPPPPGQAQVAQPGENPAQDYQEQLLDAFLSEEYAWLKAYSRAEINRRLVYYETDTRHWLNHKRHCPPHPARDRLPLAELSCEPKLDGELDDVCWQDASRSVVRVAHPVSFSKGPFVEYELLAGHRAGRLYLAVRTERLLSRHVAVVSSADGRGRGVVTLTKDGLAFNTYQQGGDADVRDRVKTERLVDGAFSENLSRFEFSVPLSLFPYCRQRGIEVGLGTGGRHVRAVGRAVGFVFSEFSMARTKPCVEGFFKVRLAAAADGGGVVLHGNAVGLENGLVLSPGQSKTIAIAAIQGPLGPEYDFRVEDDSGGRYELHLFRYDPLERQLDSMAGLIERLDSKGVPVETEREELSRLRRVQQQFLAAECGIGAERNAVLEARLIRRSLFWRDPELSGLRKVLFVKRRPFEPSHNYSVHFDAPFRPGGGVCLLEVAHRDGSIQPQELTVTELFDSGSGIARTPMADFGLNKIYFGYRSAENAYYHVMSMNTDGGGLRQLTDGPFHNYWPCPLPDGGLAFISSRCKARYLCWRPQAAVMFRMDTDGGDIRPLSFANLTEWAPSVMNDGRIIWTRSEYQDKGANFGHTLWAIRPDGTKPELVFGNDIIQPAGYANGREVPGTSEILCTLISHFGDLNGPLALVDVGRGRFTAESIHTLTPEVPWPGQSPVTECFRDAFAVSRDFYLCSHVPWRRFGLFVLDRYGNREMLYDDPQISSMCPTIFAVRQQPAVLNAHIDLEKNCGEFIVRDVYSGIVPAVKRGQAKYIRVVEEVRANLERLPNGEYRDDHPAYNDWYATPTHKVSGFYRWPTYVAKAPIGIVPIEADGSAHFYAPARKVLYFQLLDEDFNELQRMRSFVQLQPGEKRSCVGCHESRQSTPFNTQRLAARGPRQLQPPPWGAGPFSFEKVVQPVLDSKCVRCHNSSHKKGLDLTGSLDHCKIPASYRTLVERELVDYVNCGFDWGGCEKLEPLTFGTVKSRLWEVLGAGHHNVRLTSEETRRIKTWIDINCPLWPDYIERQRRPGPDRQVTKAADGGHRR